MCGIVGVVGAVPCMDVLVEGLRKLEYRGYDSAGIAIIENGELKTVRAQGKLVHLARKLALEPISGVVGIGHTRWATHGKPSEDNAHPHRSGSVAVVHNGIIENYLSLKHELSGLGYTFTSETDTEVVAHLIAHYRSQGMNLTQSVLTAARRLVGAYAIVVLDASEPDTIVGVRIASPLVVGLSPEAQYLASDVSAILEHTRTIAFLEEGQVAVLKADGVTLLDLKSGDALPLETTQVTWSPAMAEKGGYKHFMLKEIYEQPRAVADTLRGRIAIERGVIELPELNLTPELVKNLSQVYVVACGTSWHAGMVGKYLFEDLAELPVHVELASELRYRKAVMNEGSLVIAISQSGETADTLAAIREAKRKGATLISICNVIGSSIPRESHGTLYTHAGPEIGVASTKAFTTQLVALHMLAVLLGHMRGTLSQERMRIEIEALLHAPKALEAALPTSLEEGAAMYAPLARRWHEAHSMLFLGRGNLYPLALEGALKLKELSYIHAEGQAAGEIKHGPIALIDERVPTVILNPQDSHYLKVRSNLSEIRARSGPVIVVASEGDTSAADQSEFVLHVPVVHETLLPVVMAIPMQLISYYVADFKGTDVDQPRNLAKSVTVE